VGIKLLFERCTLIWFQREDATSQSSSSGVGQERNSVANKMDGTKSFENGSSINPQITSIYPQNGSFGSREHLIQETMKQKYVDSPQANGAFKRSLGEQTPVDNGGPSQFSTPSSRSLSPNRHRKDGEYESRLLPVSGINSNMSWKQDLIVKVKEGEEEIKQLKKHLADYTVKEARILTDKYMLEKRIAYMRLAFDQQQQDLVDAASKALSYRQDIIEENIRLTYALQAAQQERSTFIDSLLPLLSEYDNLQPSVFDAQSIVGNLKILFKHMQEQLIVTEEKLRESRYQITPWHTELLNSTSHPVPTDPPAGKILVTTFKLEVIGVHSVTKTIKLFQVRFLQEMLNMMTWEGTLFQAETNLGQTFLLKYPKVIIMVSVFTRPRVRTHHSRVSVEMMYWMVQRLLKSKTLKNLLLDGVLGTHLTWHLALRTQTLHILISLQSLRSLVLLSLRLQMMIHCQA